MEAIKKRVTELKKEADRLVNQREQMYKSISDLDVRLHQIVGAVNELNKILTEGEKDAGNEGNKSTVPASTNETE